jgi:hypothetical protein
MVPAGTSFFSVADRAPLAPGGSRVGPMVVWLWGEHDLAGPALGSWVAVPSSRRSDQHPSPSAAEPEPFPGYLVVSSALKARAMSGSHSHSADDESARPGGGE